MHGSTCAGTCPPSQLGFLKSPAVFHPYQGDVVQLSTRPQAGPAQRPGLSLLAKPTGSYSALQIPVEVSTLTGANLNISDVEPDVTAYGFNAIRFKLRNSEQKSLIASGLVVDLYWENRTEPLRITQAADSWLFQGVRLKPNDTSDVAIETSVTLDKKDKLLKVVVAIDYAEFDDGSWAGEDYGGFRLGFNAAREKQVAILSELAGRLRKGTSIGEVAGEIQQGPAITKNRVVDVPERKDLYYRLGVIYRNGGAAALTEKLLETPRKLPAAKTQ